MHPNCGPRRRHSDELKAKVLAACDEPGASISGVALAHGLNTNLVRKWRSGRGAKIAGVTIAPAAASKALPLGTTPEFLAIECPHRPRLRPALRPIRPARRQPPIRSSTSSCVAAHCTSTYAGLHLPPTTARPGCES